MVFASLRQPRIRFFSPEVIQTSATDCGPACLKSVLEGLGRTVSYGRLREACQTDVDGTSIDTIEEVAGLLGLEAEQQIVPLDHVLRAAAATFPSIVVLLMPGGLAHFAVLWNRVGPWVQMMDPSSGRRWVHHRVLRQQLLVHAQDVPADWWRSTADGPFATALQEGIDELALRRPGAERVERALADPTWRALATLDAATRAVSELVSSGAVARGAQAGDLLDHLLERPAEIPAGCWAVREAGTDPEHGEEVRFSGAVLLRFAPELPAEPVDTTGLPPRLEAALTDSPPRPLRALAGMIARDGLSTPAVLLGACALSAGGSVVQVVLLRALLDGFDNLALWPQRAVALLAVVALFAVLLISEWALASGLMRLGRLLEVRFRLQLFQALPRIDDRYFHSLLTSDMASRGHSIHSVRALPAVAAQLCRAVLEAAVTTLAIAWVSPGARLVAPVALACSIALPLLLRRKISEEDLRLRTHAGALSRFYLDGL
ncbi:MAG TPA: cysteine peptidase family C39 domain-containing protein, partial [Myxococcales bacterium]|nr:cysteine peptidase family C39 domain-containing protein [Myxococcales bacterium]